MSRQTYDESRIVAAKRTVIQKGVNLRQHLAAMEKAIQTLEESWDTDSSRIVAEKMRKNIRLMRNEQQVLEQQGLGRFLDVIQSEYNAAELKNLTNAEKFQINAK